MKLSPKDKLMLYCRGYRYGASGSAYEQNLGKYTDFMLGHEHGREDQQKRYAKACKRYKCELSPLRNK